MAAYSPLGRLLILFGLILIVVGVVLTWGIKLPWLGRLPGDIYIEKENIRFYFPLATSLLLSLLLSLLYYIISRWK